MLCPVDKTAMIVVEYERIELDHCTKCKGAWFDAGELDLLLNKSNIGDQPNFLILPDANVKEQSRKCPICHRNMTKKLIGDPADLCLDACPQGHGLWFDGGELHHFLTELCGKDAAKNPVMSFVSEVFKALD